jgi:flavodoxin
MTDKRLKILFIYFSFTNQVHKVVEVMSEVLRADGCDVNHARVEFVDPRYHGVFSAFPLRNAWLQLSSMLLPQLRRMTGEITVPQEMLEGDYDLICFGSPTWWLTTNMPIRSFLESRAAAKVLNGRKFAAFVVCRRYWKENLKTVKRLGTKNGGHYVAGTHFTFAGRQVASLLSFISYMGTGTNKPRYLGMKIPPTNLQPNFQTGAIEFAKSLVKYIGHD